MTNKKLMNMVMKLKRDVRNLRRLTMSQIPKDTKSKYNKDEKFIWVDAQLERMMTKQKELEDKLSELKTIVKETPNNYMLGEKIRFYFNNGIEEHDDNQINIF